MPKRMLDDSFLTSASLAKCSPRAQDAFPRFILLADDFGCFEAFPRVLVAKGWPYRQDVSEADVWGWLEEYAAAGMACLWADATERRWCYLTGWTGPHGQRARVEYKPKSEGGTSEEQRGSKRRTPPPPADLVAAILAGARRVADGKPPGTDGFPPGFAAVPADFPGGKPNLELVSDSLPGRVCGGTAADPPRTRWEPAAPAAVPAAVPVPVAGAATAAPAQEGIPTLGQHLADRYPRLAVLVESLDAAGLGRSLPRNATTRGALDQLAVRHGVEALVADVARAPEGQSLSWYATRWAGADFRPPVVELKAIAPEWPPEVEAEFKTVAYALWPDKRALARACKVERVNGSVFVSGDPQWVGYAQAAAERAFPDAQLVVNTAYIAKGSICAADEAVPF